MVQFSNKQLNLIKLLESLSLLLHENEYSGITEIINEIDKAVIDLNKRPYEGITLNARVGRVSALINDAVAFHGMHMSKDSILIWKQIKALINPGRRQDGLTAAFSITLSRL